MPKKILTLLVFILLIGGTSQTGYAAGREPSDHLKVMTRNMDAGSDFGFVLAAASHPNTTQVELLMAITQTYQEMLASNIPARAERLATEIENTTPDLIGLQEVTTLRTGPYGAPPTTVVADGLQSLLKALQRRGLHYAAVKVQTNADVQLPAFDASFNFIMVGLTDSDAVLVRSDLPPRVFKIKKIEAAHFVNFLTFPVAGQGIPFLRGWIAVDLTLGGREYRFVTTHLETFSPDYQALQTGELLSGPLAVEVPVILAGDLNSDAYTPSWTRGPAFTILAGAGFVDVWDQKHPKNPGLTWPLFAEDPPGPATPNQRIDLVLTRGEDVRVKNIHRTGLEPGFNGLWTSDHAGVVAMFSLWEQCAKN